MENFKFGNNPDIRYGYVIYIGTETFICLLKKIYCLDVEIEVRIDSLNNNQIRFLKEYLYVKYDLTNDLLYFMNNKGIYI